MNLKMEKPEAPEGWEVREWDYRGDKPREYDVDYNHIIFSLRRLKDGNSVWLELRVGTPDKGIKSNYFNVYRSGSLEVPAIDPNIRTARQGIEYCLTIAKKYMDTPTEEIPGAREGFFRTRKKIARLAERLGIRSINM